jgi:hypothetical protein
MQAGVVVKRAAGGCVGQGCDASMCTPPAGRSSSSNASGPPSHIIHAHQYNGVIAEPQEVCACQVECWAAVDPHVVRGAVPVCSRQAGRQGKMCAGRYGARRQVPGLAGELLLLQCCVPGRAHPDDTAPTAASRWQPTHHAHLSITGGSGSCSSSGTSGTSGSGCHSSHSWSISCTPHSSQHERPLLATLLESPDVRCWCCGCTTRPHIRADCCPEGETERADAMPPAERCR